ncbi:MAG: TonB-dependent receptor [Bacteroides sp.]|jgi:TonB-linked SusC/RagA family outer membrane protein|nr:TonB-dependent receptor [Phocaeicola faecicola]MCI5743810.1 TonB-dependent receptor [Bacteroides sp.]MDD6908245.1 TonB-dependent receptor [Bacteroidaceae bacterium]MDY4871658.1 TonB-dependent receptor [Phocaeicola faecicola]
MRRFFLLFVLCLIGASIYAQSMKVTGKVVDGDGLEVIGASVVVKGAAGVGTITDLNGTYSLTVNDASKDVLVFSYVGMASQEIKVNGRSQINVTLKSDAVLLDEVVAIGYATVKRKDLTGSVASVNSKELSKIPTSDVTQALAGRMAGVQVMQSEGAPGASISIRVRGGISITQSNEPLYIIDGFPSEDGMSTLDPAEIESIDILKDASATAIYGARGANGVVVITTKSGAQGGGKATVTFDSYVGFKKIAKKLDVLSPYEFVKLDYERKVYDQTDSQESWDAAVKSFETIYGKYSDIEANYANREGIDWQDQTLGRTALTQNYRIGVSGGTDKLNYSMAYSYYDEEGAMVFSGSKKHNISFNLNSKVNDRLTVTARMSFDHMRVEGMGTSEGGDRFNKMQHILQYRPTIGINGSDSDLLGDEDPLFVDDAGNVMQNPLLSAAEETKDKEYRTFQANGGFTFKIIKGLSFRNTTGMRYQTRRNDIFYGDKSVTGKRSSINGSIENIENGSFQTSNVLTYNWSNESNDLTVMAGQEFVSKWTRNFKASASNFPNDEIGLGDLSLGLAGTPESYQNYDDKLLSFFTRVNYNYKEKYLFTASLRADGSSKFGKNNKWGYFPAFSAAWRMGEEEFIKNLNVFSDLKLRIGYGLAGNNRINSYQSLAIMGSVTYPNGDSTQSGYASNQVPNPELKWEANKTFNFGLDFGFFNQRLTISPEFYINRSSNLLLSAKLPDSSGYSSMVINAGETENKGIDLTINTVNIETKDFSWNTAITFSHNKNLVKKLTGEEVQLWEASFGYSQNTHIIGVNQPLGQMYGYVTDGLYQVEDFDYDAATKTYTLKDGIPYMGDKQNVQPGNWKFKNLDGSADNKITESDKTVIGNAYPIFYGGINNNFTYKNFDLSIFFTYSYGNDVFNATKLTNTKSALDNKNVLDVANSANRWVLVNDKGEMITDPQELAAVNKGKTVASIIDNEVGDTYIHSWAVEDGSFLKLSNVTLGYTFPKAWLKKLGVSKLRLYATGSNLFTWTKYSGFDPEVSTMGNGLTPGVDFGAYPKSRSFVFGINLAF